jgi:hypothetical protein
VPFATKALDLDYYRPDLAWSLLEERYPDSSLSYTPSGSPKKPFNDFIHFAPVKEVILNRLQHETKFQQQRKQQHANSNNDNDLIPKETFQKKTVKFSDCFEGSAVLQLLGTR